MCAGAVALEAKTVPAEQLGQFYRSGGKWGIRYYDENGVRRRQGGFDTKTQAGKWIDGRLDTVEALRRGDTCAVRRQAMPTFAELVAEYVEQHSAERNTLHAASALAVCDRHVRRHPHR